MAELRLSVGGDPEGGWLVDIHDGARHETYRPEAATLPEALMTAWREHDPELVVSDPKMTAALAEAVKNLTEAQSALEGAQALHASDSDVIKDIRDANERLSAKLEAANAKISELSQPAPIPEAAPEGSNENKP